MNRARGFISPHDDGVRVEMEGISLPTVWSIGRLMTYEGRGERRKRGEKKKRKKKERGEKKGRRNWMINLPNSTPRSNKLHSSLYRVIFSRYALSAHSLHAWIGQFALLCVTFMRYLDASSFHFFFFLLFSRLFRDDDKNWGSSSFLSTVWKHSIENEITWTRIM